MERENATQEECDIEREEECHILMEWDKALKIVINKRQEWKTI
jgi:hypothetical protein